MDHEFMYVAFEGPIAAGKTTLAKLFASHKKANLLLEDFENNAFLEDYYSDSVRWALPMQLSFLAARHKQLLAVPTHRTMPLIADHTYAKDAIFAHALLQGRELMLYEELRRSLSGQAPKPDVIVYLDAPNAILLERVRERGREYEQGIDNAYLDKIRTAYERELLGEGSSRIMSVDTAALDIGSSSQLLELFNSIEVQYSRSDL